MQKEHRFSFCINLEGVIFQDNEFGLFSGRSFETMICFRNLLTFNAFSILSFKASINAGSLISTFLTPLLRNKKCDGRDTCFPLAFGVPAALFLVAILAFLGGRICKFFQSNIYQKKPFFLFGRFMVIKIIALLHFILKVICIKWSCLKKMSSPNFLPAFG